MSISAALSRIPVLRVLVPFAVGIIIHRLWHCWWVPIILIALSVGIYLLISLLSQSPQDRVRIRRYSTHVLALVALSLGWLAAVISCPPCLSPGQREGRALIGRVIDLSYTDFSMRLTVDVLDRDLPRCKVLVTTRGCDYTMQTGDVITWSAALHQVNSLGNPDEMDYAAYLLDTHGIRYEQHLPVKRLVKTGHSPTLFTHLSTARRQMRHMVMNSDIHPAAQQLLIAMLLGESSQIDKVTRQEFAAAGVAHILALSGLHIGLIALIIWLLLFPLDHLGLRKVRLVITLLAIMLFAIFTGLSASVVRATVMTGMVLISLLMSRRAVSLNALAIAALVILVFNPSALYSVGFQLSFITVAALLVFARLPRRLVSRFIWVNRLTTIVISSLVAMLATMALTAYYFHNVSLMSVVSNLFVIPALPVFMVLGALFLLVTAAGMHWPVLNWSLNATYGFIHRVTTTVSTLPFSHIDGVYVSTIGVILWFMLMGLLITWLYRRDYSFLLTAGCVLIILLAHAVWIEVKTPRQGLIILNSYSSTPILYYNHNEGIVWTPDDEETDSLSFVRHYAGFLSRRHIDRLTFIDSDDTISADHVRIKPPVAYMGPYRLIAVGGNHWKRVANTLTASIDDIIVTKRYHGRIIRLQELYHPERLIISGAHYESARLQRECDSLGIKVILGAYQFK